VALWALFQDEVVAFGQKPEFLPSIDITLEAKQR